MKMKLAAAAFAVPAMFVGATLAGEDVAEASELVTVCNREVLNPFGGWDCVEWTTCVLEADMYFCDDGTHGNDRSLA